MNSKGLILWLGGFAGLGLLYSAYKGKSPLTTLKSVLTSTSGSSGGTTQATPSSYNTSSLGNSVTAAPTINAPTVPAVYQQYPASYIPNTNTVYT